MPSRGARLLYWVCRRLSFKTPLLQVVLIDGHWIEIPLYGSLQLPCRMNWGYRLGSAGPPYTMCGRYTVKRFPSVSWNGGVNSYRRPSARVSLRVTSQVSSTHAWNMLR